MNFLAHIYLSGDDPEITIGNFIADHVKGNDFHNYSPGIRKGILLHRAIDHFTDNNSIVEKSKSHIRHSQKKYTPVVTDIFYDHFLAANWKIFSRTELEVFADNFYKLTAAYRHVIPQRTGYMLDFMTEQNWLVKYAEFEGLQKVFNGMSKRVSFENNMQHAVSDLKAHYPLLEEEFMLFFSELKNFAAGELRSLNR